MKLKDKIKSYSFWVSLASAVILILKVLGNRFGFTVDESMISDLFTALCSILVLLGIIVVPGVSSQQLNTNKNNLTNTINNPETESKQNKELQDDKETIITELNLITEETNQNNNNFQILDEKTNIKENTCLETIKETLQPINENNNTDNLIVDLNQEAVFEEFPSQNKIFYETNVEPSNNNSSENQFDSFNQTSNISNLKELFNNERAKFSKNINEYIFELQEEIRRVRENM